MRIKNNCSKATFLVEKSLSGRIIFAEKVELKIHLAGCTACRQYLQQSRSINKLARKLLHGSADNLVVMDELFKDDLKKMIISRTRIQDDSNTQ